jgi:hypothetical protein
MITDIARLQPRVDMLREITNKSVAIDLEVWWHRFAHSEVQNGLPTVEWKVVTFEGDAVKSFRAPTLEAALVAAENHHTLATTVGVVVTP